MTDSDELRTKLENIIRHHNKQLADLDRGFPVHTQVYFVVNQLLALIHQHTAEVEAGARIDELGKFSHSGGSVHILAEKVSYKPEGHDPISTWPILVAEGGLIIVLQDYLKERLAQLTKPQHPQKEEYENP